MRHHPDDLVVKFDAFTYTGNLENLEDVKVHPNYRFVHGDLQKTMDISKAFSEYNVTQKFIWQLNHMQTTVFMTTLILLKPTSKASSIF